MNVSGLGLIRWLIILCGLAHAVADPAPAPSTAWRITFTELKIEIDPAKEFLKGTASLRMERAGAAADSILLELNHELTVNAVSNAAGEPLDFKRKGANLRIRCGQRDEASADVMIRVHYQGSFSERVPEIGFHNGWIGPECSYATCAASWYPQLKEPQRRSKGKVSYYVPENWTVASAGRLFAEKILPSGSQFDFEITSPVQFGFAAGPFRALRRNIDGLEAGIFLLGGGPDKAEYYLEQCSGIIRFLKDYYGVFPYDGYSVVEIPQEALGNAGGGSYEGLTLFTPAAFPDGYFSPHIFGHEISHLWWGGFVRGAEGPVINEVLAQLSTALYLERLYGEKTLRKILRDGAPELSLIHSARSYFQALRAPAASSSSSLSLLLRGEDLPLGVSSPEKTNTLHMLANSKGCFVFVMLRDLIGAEAFQTGLRGALARFAWKTVTLDDLRAEFEKAAGRDLKWFFDQWFFRTGAPEFELTFETEARGAGWEVKGRIRQLRDVYRVAAEIAFVKAGSRETRIVEVASAETEFSLILPFKPDKVFFDPDYRILRWSDM